MKYADVNYYYIIVNAKNDNVTVILKDYLPQRMQWPGKILQTLIHIKEKGRKIRNHIKFTKPNKYITQVCMDGHQRTLKS